MPFIDPKPGKQIGTLNGKWKNNISPFHQPWKSSPPERDDVGIVPYIPVRVHSIQPGASKPSGFGRLVAAPTGVLGRVPLGGVSFLCGGSRFGFPWFCRDV